jgi:hypothetical protein
MAMKEQSRKVYKSMQGKEIDVDKLRARNELTLAVGNARVNARGDELGAGGKIIRKREDVMAEYYTKHPDSIPTKQKTAKAPKTVAEQTDKNILDQDLFGEEE